jgi:hypothetical protein
MKKENLLDAALSRGTGELGTRIKTLTREFLQAWWETGSTLPTFFKTYTLNEQKKIEKEIAHFVEKMLAYSKEYSAAPGSLDFREPITQTREYVKRFFHTAGIEIDDSFSKGIAHSTNIFIEKIKRFDPAMAPENIYQALRNIWVANTLQVYFGVEMGCTDSIFAYSMFYPYTDNIMDDVTAGLEKKLSINRNLKKRLEGEPYHKPEGVELQLDALAKLVEKEFPRDRYPAVYRGLLGIYNAQIKSLIQQKQDVPPFVVDIPAISFEKGGASVLTDGYLIKGELNEAQEKLCFGLGAFLQLADDIQDIVPDKQNHHMTIFSQAAGRWKLDALANKLFRFIPVVIPGDKNPGAKKLDELFFRSFYLHIMEAVGKNSHLYSEAYIKEIRCHFPVRFSFLGKLRKKLKKVLLKQEKGVLNLDVVSAGLMALTARVYE